MTGLHPTRWVAIAPHLFSRHGSIMTESNVEKAMKSMFVVPPEKRNDRETIERIMKDMSETERKVVEIFFLGREAMERTMVDDLLSCKDFLR
jgi:carboxymethylenebutenolidase